MGTMIRVEHASVMKQNRAVLGAVTLAFDSGASYSILGPSGAGKTTLLRLLNRLEEPSSGALWYRDARYREISPITLRRRVAMVFQVPVVFPGTVRDNLMTPLRLQKRASADQAVLVGRLELAGLDGGFLDRDASELSVGEKQRVCIARALMNDPEVLLLDEPTAALDPATARRLIESIVDLNHRLGLTVIMVTHQPEQARVFGAQVILLSGGTVAEEASAAEFFVAPATAEGRRYLNLSEAAS